MKPFYSRSIPAGSETQESSEDDDEIDILTYEDEELIDIVDGGVDSTANYLNSLFCNAQPEKEDAAAQFKCDACQTLYKDNKSFLEHLKKNYTVTTYQCLHCNFSSRSRITEIVKHMKAKHAKTPLYCRVRVKYCIHTLSLASRANVPEKKNRFYCQNCPSNFSVGSRLKSHSKTECGIKYVCLSCHFAASHLTIVKHMSGTHKR